MIAGRRIVAAREVDLLGRPGPDLPIDEAGAVRVSLGAWEIRTFRVRLGAASPNDDSVARAVIARRL